MMRPILSILLLIVFAVTSCDTAIKKNKPSSEKNSIVITTSSDFSKDIVLLNDKLKKLETPSQIIKTKSKTPSIVKGKKGTTIYVNPDDLETVDGGQIAETIEIELKELTNQKEFLSSNTQTISNGRLLVSGGAYYINMTSNGQQLKLKSGKNLKVELPKISNPEMGLFYGQRDSLGKINWQEAQEKFLSKKIASPDNQNVSDQARGDVVETSDKSDIDAIIDYINEVDTASNKMAPQQKEKIRKEYKLVEKVYEAINIKSLGWINCDRFWEIKNKTDLRIEIEPSDSAKCTNVYLVFKDISSILQTYCFDDKRYSSNNGFQDIPLGMKTRLIAYAIKNEKVYSYSTDYTIKAKDIIKIDLKETSEADFKKLIGK
jgi:hypothetical protein